jgi:uncharacterized protein with FMN-binding domain
MNLGVVLTFFLLASLAAGGACADTIEFLSGAKLSGVVKEIRKSEQEFDFKAIELLEKVDVTGIDDGEYTGSRTGYNKQLDVWVKLVGGKIESLKVTQRREKQFYSALTDTEQQIRERQSVRGVDGTSGATITSRAMVNGTAKVLASGSR